MKALVGAFNQKALVGAFSVIVQPVVEPMDRFTALVVDFSNLYFLSESARPGDLIPAERQKGVDDDLV